MSILIVVESMFGNSRAVAEAAAEGARATGAEVATYDVAEAPAQVAESVTLLVLGGPTHAFSMTRRTTRADAHRQGARLGSEEIGIREWIERAQPRGDLPVVTFDTRIPAKWVPGSAAKSAAGALRRRGFAAAERGPTFLVAGTSGPLLEGETERAREWGADLALRSGTSPQRHTFRSS